MQFCNLLSLHFTFHPGYNPSLNCQCNNKCGFYGNCCDDYKEVCNNGGGIGNISSGSCHGLCGNGELGKMAKLYPTCILRMLNIWARFDACMGIFWLRIVHEAPQSSLWLWLDSKGDAGKLKAVVHRWLNNFSLKFIHTKLHDKHEESK